MAGFSAVCFGFVILLLISGNATDAGTRVVRSPQFGFGQPQASAQAQAGAGFGGGGFGPPRPYFRPQPRPPFGPGGFGQGGFGQGGLGQGGSISISKSISISRGGASQSSAQSSAAGK